MKKSAALLLVVFMFLTVFASVALQQIIIVYVQQIMLLRFTSSV